MGRLDEVLEMTGTVGLFMDISGTKVMRIDTKNSQQTGIGEEKKETVDTFRYHGTTTNGGPTDDIRCRIICFNDCIKSIV